MSTLHTETIDALAALGTEMPRDVRVRHRSEIAAALRDAAPIVRRRSRRRGFRVAAISGLLVVLPVGMAVAAEDALPDDVLYPVKLATEPLIAFVDDDIVATHRVDELTRILAADATLDRVMNASFAAGEAVDELPLDHRLRTTLQTLRQAYDLDAIAIDRRGVDQRVIPSAPSDGTPETPDFREDPAPATRDAPDRTTADRSTDPESPATSVPEPPTLRDEAPTTTVRSVDDGSDGEGDRRRRSP